jgi:hypothetical protein
MRRLGPVRRDHDRQRHAGDRGDRHQREESAALAVPLHSPAFLFERTSWDQNGRTVEFVHSVYRGERYRIVTELNHREP